MNRSKELKNKPQRLRNTYGYFRHKIGNINQIKCLNQRKDIQIEGAEKKIGRRRILED